MPGQPKRFIAIGISIAAMAMSTFNTENHTTKCQNQHSERKDQSDIGRGSFTWETFASPGGETGSNKQTSGRPFRLEDLVLLQSHRHNRKEISICGAPSQKRHQICSAPQTRSRHSSPWNSGWHHQPRCPGCQEKESGTLRQICLRPLPNWGFTPLYTCHQHIYTHSAHTNGLQHQSAQPLRILAIANSLQLCHQHLVHSRRQSNKPARNWTLSVLSNYFQLWLTCLPPPWRHFLLQRKESHGNKLEKILFSGTLYGQLPLNSEPLPLKNGWSLQENIWTVRKHLGRVLSGNNQHQPSLSRRQCCHRDADSIRQHHLDEARMLRAHHWSRHLHRQIQDHQGQDQGHRLGRGNHRLDPPWEQGSNPPSTTRTPDQVQWQIQCHHSTGPTWSILKPRSTLGIR